MPSPLASWHWGWVTATVVLALLTWLLAFAKPIEDSDLWWQMAYARQILAKRTLILDHTVFSWTPADNRLHYCSWTMQLLLYGLHCLGGLTPLFVFRYGCILVLPFFLWLYARKRGVAGHPLTWVVCTLCLLMSSWAGYIKPQIASFVFMVITVWVWMEIKRRGEHAWRWCYLIPVLMLLWVNSHGGFIFGLTFLGAMAVGEFLNIFVAHLSGRSRLPQSAVPGKIQLHLFLALVLTGIVVFANPYTWEYPWQLLTSMPKTPMTDLKTVREYDSIFASGQGDWHFVDYGLISIGILAMLLIPSMWRRRIDLALVLVNVTFAYLYAKFLRLTFFWAPIVAFSTVGLLAEGPGWLIPRRRISSWLFGTAMLFAGVGLAGRVIYQSATHPSLCSWWGFGNSYVNPEEEAVYIGRNFPGYRMGNDYNSGGYLLWTLWPKMKVFIDSRYFPFKAWYGDYSKLETTEGIEDSLRKFPCDFWCIDLPLSKTIGWFQSSPDWIPAFYGASAAVFVRKGLPVPSGKVQAGKGIGKIRNFYQALLVFTFAMDAKDWSGAEQVVAGMEERFRHSQQLPHVTGARASLNGVLAFNRGDYEVAISYLRGARETFSATATSMLAQCYYQLTRQQWNAMNPKKALEMALDALRYAPNDPPAQYNVGVIVWSLASDRGKADTLPSMIGSASSDVLTVQNSTQMWKQHLQGFLRTAQADRGVPPGAVEVANAILQGSFRGRPPLMVPGELGAAEVGR